MAKKHLKKAQKGGGAIPIGQMKPKPKQARPQSTTKYQVVDDGALGNKTGWGIKMRPTPISSDSLAKEIMQENLKPKPSSIYRPGPKKDRLEEIRSKYPQLKKGGSIKKKK
jgi:hypothetical protein